MNLSDDVDLEDFVARPDKISGADIHSICQEAGKFQTLIRGPWFRIGQKSSLTTSGVLSKGRPFDFQGRPFLESIVCHLGRPFTIELNYIMIHNLWIIINESF